MSPRSLRPGPLYALLLAGCGALPIRDELPPEIPRDRIASSIYLGVARDLGDGEQMVHWGSGVIVGPRRVLTAKHLWFDFPTDPEWPRDSKRVDVYVSPSRWLTNVEFRLLAEGSPDDFLGDWVLLETDTPCWTTDHVACIHAPAARHAWRPPADTTIWVAGFGGLFNEANRSRQDFLRQGPYAIGGSGAPATAGLWMKYDKGWPPPEGASGGGMYLWSEAQSRMELVGLFVECLSWPFGLGSWLRGVPIGLIAGATEL